MKALVKAAGVALLCSQLSGCFFIWIPPGLIRAITEPRPGAVVKAKKDESGYKGPAVEAVR